MKVDSNRNQYAILGHSKYGPSFGFDIFIANNSNTTMDSNSNLGDCYKHPQYAQGTNEAQTFLSGSNEFQLNEIEVYHRNLE